MTRALAPLTRGSHPRVVGIGAAALLLTLVLSLGGCGKKPDFVDPPPGTPPEAFPSPYPNPDLDRGAGGGFRFP